MRKVINNLLYGQTSQYLSGRFDSDIYSQGCARLENFDVMLQGGIKRRPPRRVLFQDFTNNPSKIVNYTVDTTNSFIAVFCGATNGVKGTVSVIDCTDISNPVKYDIPYTREGVDESHGWSDLTQAQLKNIKSVVYYNDLLLVHPDVPLMRIHYAGGALTKDFDFTIPELRINQSSTYWDNDNINYGKDDFNPMKLNDGPNHYASQIAVISERLYLGCTYEEPYKIWASSVSETSQEIEEQLLSDGLFDFIQFRVVETQNTEVDTSKIPVKWDGENYLGSAYSQQIWDIREFGSSIQYQSDYEECKLKYSLRVKMVEGSSDVYEIYHKVGDNWQLFIKDFNYENNTAKVISQSGETSATFTTSSTDNRILKVEANGIKYAEAIPVYITDLASINDMLSISTELSLTATDSTSMEFQLASGRNDKVTLIGSGDYIMVGTESSIWNMSNKITALDFGANMYGSFGSPTGLHSNISTDLIILERGNKARLFYKDYYGLQTINLSLTCPEILEGTIKEIACKETDTPQVYFLKNNNGVNSIVCLSLDRTNGIQGWAEWKFTTGNIESIGVIENSEKQYLVALVNDNGKTYLGYFDSNENNVFSDCSLVDSSFVDYQEQYISLMETNPFESETDNGTTFGEDKIIDKIIFRAINTGRIISQTNDDIENITRFKVAENCIGDFEININGGTSKEIAVTIKSFESDPLTLLCMAYDMRLVDGN